MSPPWKYYLGLFRPVWRRLALGLLFLVAQAFLYVPVLWLVKLSLDHAIPQKDWPGVLLNSLYALVSLFLSTGLGLWARVQALEVSQTVVGTLRSRLLERFLSFSRQRYTGSDIPTMRLSVVVDTDRLENMNYIALTQLLPGMLGGLILGGVLLIISPRLLLALILIIPVLIWVGQVLHKAVRSANLTFQRSMLQLGVATSLMTQLLDLVHMQSTEDRELAAKGKIVHGVTKDSKTLWLWRVLYTETQSLIILVTALAVFIFGSHEVILGRVTPGALATFYVVLALLANVLRPVWGAFPGFIGGVGSLQTLYEILKDADEPPYPGKKKIRFQGHIRLDDVTFGYNNVTVLDHFSVELQPGRRVAIIGPNGAGKTSVAHLILGFYKPYSGEVLADNHAYRDLDIVDLRRQIGVVPQHHLLWPGTIWENLIYGNESLSKSEVLAVSKLVEVDEFAPTLPEGYDTPVGESGILLSGGQRQRITIARALMRRPKLLILDELTNHLDAASANHLLNSLSELDYGPSILLITHDMSIAQSADEVLELGLAGEQPLIW